MHLSMANIIQLEPTPHKLILTVVDSLLKTQSHVIPEGCCLCIIKDVASVNIDKS